MQHKSAVVGETIAFSICNKSFKALALPSGRVKSCKGLPEIIPTNIEVLYCQSSKNLHTNIFSYVMSIFNKINITSRGQKKSINS
jgi:hypothetical protein